MAVNIKLGVQMANNLAAEIEGDNVADVLQALQDISKGIEANLSAQAQAPQVPQERKGLIIPEVKVKGPIREDSK
jgi:hypothetical protein